MGKFNLTKVPTYISLLLLLQGVIDVQLATNKHLKNAYILYK